MLLRVQGLTQSGVDSEVGRVWVGGATHTAVGAVRPRRPICPGTLHVGAPHPQPSLPSTGFLTCWPAELLRSANVCGESRAFATHPKDLGLCCILTPAP